MKIVFHAGQPKTGTTTLQHTFAAARETLLERGILYPSDPVGGYRDHRLLCGDLTAPGDTPRSLLWRHTVSELPQLRRALTADIAAQVARHRPHTLVLSSEHRFALLSLRGRSIFAETLQGLGGGAATVEIVAYLRRPSDLYQSLLQQNMRHSWRVLQPRDLACPLAVADQMAADVGRAHLHLRPFDRTVLRGGDLVSDFCATALDPALAADLPSIPDHNAALSNESVDLIRRFRQRFAWHDNDRNLPDSRRLQAVCRRADARLGLKTGALVPGLAERIDYAHTRFLTLRARYGVALPGYDYDRLERGALAPGFKSEEYNAKNNSTHAIKLHTLGLTNNETRHIPAYDLAFEEVCAMNPADRTALIGEVSESPWIRKSRARAAWLAGLPAEIAAEARGDAPVHAVADALAGACDDDASGRAHAVLAEMHRAGLRLGPAGDGNDLPAPRSSAISG